MGIPDDQGNTGSTFFTLDQIPGGSIRVAHDVKGRGGLHGSPDYRDRYFPGAWELLLAWDLVPLESAWAKFTR